MKKKENKNKIHMGGRGKSKRVVTPRPPKAVSSTLFLMGVDEVGRGPLAGPVTVCVAMIRSGTEVSVKKELKRLSGKAYPIGKDSKKMTEGEREFWFEYFRVLERLGDISFFVGSKSAKEIDRKGIAVCIQELVNSLVNKTAQDKGKGGLDLNTCELRCDAGLKTSVPVFSQKAIVKGDENEFIISIASVYAKVSRDRYMKKIAKKGEFLKYGFEVHKGYGTMAHRIAIKKYGLSSQHRRSFCENILTKSR